MGIAFLHPAWSFKLIILVFFVMLTNPVSSHALARAWHAIGIHKTETMVVDQLGLIDDADAQNGEAEDTGGAAK